MIHHLNGRLVEKNPNYVVIDCGGVGYRVNISLNTYSAIGNDEAISLLTHLQVKEDAHVLFGFISKDERELFLKLISVSGVGTTTAQMMLSAYQTEDIIRGIVNEDVGFLKSIKGIGAKTAQRVIVDLKDKLSKGEIGGEISLSSYNTAKDEALSALLALGFDKNSSNRVLDKILKTEPELELEELLKQALKNL